MELPCKIYDWFWYWCPSDMVNDGTVGGVLSTCSKTVEFEHLLSRSQMVVFIQTSPSARLAWDCWEVDWFTLPSYNNVVEEMNNFFKTNISIKYFINLKKLYRRGVTLGHLC